MGASMGGGAYSRPVHEPCSFLGQVFADCAGDCNRVCDGVLYLATRIGTLAMCRVMLLVALICAGAGAQELAEAWEKAPRCHYGLTIINLNDVMAHTPWRICPTTFCALPRKFKAESPCLGQK